jgi:hypothetical protein
VVSEADSTRFTFSESIRRVLLGWLNLMATEFELESLVVDEVLDIYHSLMAHKASDGFLKRSPAIFEDRTKLAALAATFL